MRVGYACQCTAVASKTRGCILKTYQTKGLPLIKDLILENLNSLEKIFQFNKEHNIRLFRISSDIFPWRTRWNWKDMPERQLIFDTLTKLGQQAKIQDLRLTMHPGPFNILSSPNSQVVHNTILELDRQSEVFDLLGFAPSYENPVNIHLGGAYGDKPAAIARWMNNYKKLADHTKKRLTIENDDRPNLYTTGELLPISQKLGIPIKFDFYHNSCHPDKLTQDELIKVCAQTWTQHGQTPIFHWSESRAKEQNNPSISKVAHSDYITQLPYHPEVPFDIMIEAKQKEQALLGNNPYATHKTYQP